MNIELTDQELKLLLQSLDHCLATCQNKSAEKDQPCEDCDAATALRTRLANLAERKS
jgi:hypothetical protein